MSKISKIEWTDAVWEPVGGCRHASEGCRNCYAETLIGGMNGLVPSLFSGRGGKGNRRYDGLVALKSDRARFTGEIALWPDKLVEPLRWRKPRTVFVCSQSDLFYEERPFRHIELVHYIYAATGHIKYLELTKRPERRREFLTWYQHCRRTGIDAVKYVNALLPRPLSPAQEDAIVRHRGTFDNVARGVSVEDQTTADARIPVLLATPAATRFVSYEPALAAVDFDEWMYFCPTCDDAGHRGRGEEPSICGREDCRDGRINRGLSWVIAGAESGPGARPADLAWFRAVRDQCAASGVAYFLKQADVCEGCAGVRTSIGGYGEMPTTCTSCKGTGRAGKVRKGCPALDGVVHDARPAWLTGGAQ